MKRIKFDGEISRELLTFLEYTGADESQLHIAPNGEVYILDHVKEDGKIHEVEIFHDGYGGIA